jgi:DNA-binding IclR family transcriptional regulator
VDTGGDAVDSRDGDAVDSRSVARRITRLLAALSAADDDGLPAAELARRAELPPATAHRLLVELEREGVAVRRAGNRAWALGGMVLGWGDAARRQQAGRSQFHDVLRAIGKSTKETVVLTAREGWHGTHTDLVESPTGLRIVERVGLRLPLTVGASRRAILAFLPEAGRQRVLSRYVPTGPRREWLSSSLDLTREMGFSVSAGEVTAYSVGIAVPLLSQGVATASIMVGGPALRVTAAALQHALGAMTELIHPRNLLPPLDIDKTADALAAAEELRQRIPPEF